jgi:hypothetical protein
MRKLLHLDFAVWKTDRPFDPKHFTWESAGEADPSPAAAGALAVDVAGPVTDRTAGTKPTHLPPGGARPGPDVKLPPTGKWPCAGFRLSAVNRDGSWSGSRSGFSSEGSLVRHRGRKARSARVS